MPEETILLLARVPPGIQLSLWQMHRQRRSFPRNLDEPDYSIFFRGEIPHQVAGRVALPSRTAFGESTGKLLPADTPRPWRAAAM